MPETDEPRPVRDVQYASEGRGPLIRRDYWAAIAGTDCTPEDLGRLLRRRFCSFAPPETAEFRRRDGGDRPLEIGDELEIRIALMGKCRVRVVQADDRSLTLRTLRGHPEAGRITFGARRDDQGRLRIHICSRTRASSLANYLGFLVMGKQMQSRTWIKFIDKFAAECGGRIPEAIHVEGPVEVPEQPADCRGVEEPTFACRDGGEAR